MAVHIDAVNNILDMAVPSIVGEDESDVLRVILFGVGKTLANIQIFVTTPSGQTKEITSSFADVSAYLPFSVVSLFEMNYTFETSGQYTFMLYDATSGDVWVDNTFSAPWAAKMDMSISDIYKQRTDIERVYSKLNRGNHIVR